MDRRSFLATSAGGTAGVLLPLSGPKAIAAYSDPDKYSKEYFAGYEQKKHEVTSALEDYRKQCEAAAITIPVAAGISVPFATTPLNYYMRGQLPPATFPAYRWLSRAYLDAVDDALTDLMFVRLPPTRVVRRPIRLKPTALVAYTGPIKWRPMPSRIVTPRFTFDLDEAMHRGEKDTRCARILIEFYAGLAQEVNARLHDYHEQGGTDRIVIEPIKVYFKREAFMVDAFAATTICDERFCEPIECPTTTLS